MMKKIRLSILLSLPVFLLLFSPNKIAIATSCPVKVNNGNETTFYTPTGDLTIRFDLSNSTLNVTHFIISHPGCPGCGRQTVQKDNDGYISYTYTRPDPYQVADLTTEIIYQAETNLIPVCDPITIHVKESACDITFTSDNNQASVNSKFTAHVTNLPPIENDSLGYNIKIDGKMRAGDNPIYGPGSIYIGPLGKGTHTITMVEGIGITKCSKTLVVGEEGTTLPKEEGKPSAETGPCSAIKDGTDERKKCGGCIEGKDEKGNKLLYGPGSWSALGCIPTGPEKFIQWLLNSAINIVGGLAFLMILFGSFKVATSSGNPEALNEGKDIIFAALAGLLFIVFSVILLKIIGHDILQIPGFQ